MPYTLPTLPYPYEALEPYIDTKTMELHYSKHHQTYVDKLNEALGKHPELASKPLEELLKDLNAVPEDIRTAVRNHGGGHYNHSRFWTYMAPKEAGTAEMGDDLHRALTEQFGKFDDFKQQFNDAAMKVFGSGWAWLVIDEKGSLAVKSLPNQDAPAMMGWKPVLGLDVWEHAYYLKYQNKRPDYIAAWWNVANWKKAEGEYKAATS
jgi:Fe-Mn family superoxide dismutase